MYNMVVQAFFSGLRELTHPPFHTSYWPLIRSRADHVTISLAPDKPDWLVCAFLLVHAGWREGGSSSHVPTYICVYRRRRRMIRPSKIRKHYLSPSKPMFLLILLFTLSSVADVDDSANGKGKCLCGSFSCRR